MIRFGVVSDGNVFEQYVGHRMASMALRRGNGVKLITADVGLILLVPAVECSDLEVVGSNDFREVIFPDKEVFAILPWRLVPQRFVTTWPPYKTRECRALWMREDGRENALNGVVERLRARAGVDEDIVAGTRKLKLVDGG